MTAFAELARFIRDWTLIVSLSAGLYILVIVLWPMLKLHKLIKFLTNRVARFSQSILRLH